MRYLKINGTHRLYACTIKDLVEQGMLKAPDIHRETIDGAIERKAKRK